MKLNYTALGVEKDPQLRHHELLPNTCLHMVMMGNSLNGLYLSSKPGHFGVLKWTLLFF